MLRRRKGIMRETERRYRRKTHPTAPLGTTNLSNNIIYALIEKDMNAVVTYVRHYPGICLY
jgi:hypothetical protein